MSSAEAKLAEAKYEAEQSRKRLIATAGTLQFRLKPGNLASNAWVGLREKSEELAEDAIQAIRDRPIKASGIVAGIALFLARDSIRAAVSGLWGRDEQDDED